MRDSEDRRFAVNDFPDNASRFEAYEDECDRLEADLSASQAREAELREKLIVLIRARIYEFDSCITAIAVALGSPACGGVDVPITDPLGTTQVLVKTIAKLREREMVLVGCATKLLDALNNEAKAEATLENAVDNFSDYAPEADRAADAVLSSMLAITEMRTAINSTSSQAADQVPHFTDFDKSIPDRKKCS